MSKREPDTGALRITDQHRSKDSMVYDLRCKDARLTLSVSRGTDDARPQDWRIDAQSGRGVGVHVVTAHGPTRADALRLVGESWTSSEERDGLPHFDWTAIASALAAVRAL
jgi:hypothetical protein